MGLELKVSADDVKSLFTKDRNLLMAALRHKDARRGSMYSPNLYASPLSLAAIYLRRRSVPKYLEITIGFDQYSYQSILTTAADTWHSQERL